MTTREELIEQAAAVLRLHHIDMGTADRAQDADHCACGPLVEDWDEHWVKALVDGGLLADPEQAAELERLRAGIAAALHGLESDLDADASLPKRVEELAEDFMTLRLREIAEAPEHRRRQRQIAAGLKLIDDQMALFGSVMSEDKVGLLRDIRAALTGEVTLDD